MEEEREALDGKIVYKIENHKNQTIKLKWINPNRQIPLKGFWKVYVCLIRSGLVMIILLDDLQIVKWSFL